MVTLLPVQHLEVSVERPPEDVYAFVSNPENLPKWAAGLSGSIENVAGEWIADSPMGRVKVAFVKANTYGVLDHNVTLPSGQTFYNPMRVFPNGDGCEIVFTLFKQPDMTEERFAEDAKMILSDLQTLRELLEHRG